MKKFKSILHETTYRIIRAHNASRSTVACKVFGRHFDLHLVEPHATCLPEMEALLRFDGRLKLHAAALGSSSDHELHPAIEPNAVTTGAHVTIPNIDIGATIAVPVETLENTFRESLTRHEAHCSKLIFEGGRWKRAAARVRMFLNVELAFAKAYKPPINAIVRFFDDAGFDLHHIASITGMDRDNRGVRQTFFSLRAGVPQRDTAWA